MIRTRIPTRTALALGISGLALGLPLRAAAYSDYELFGLPPLEGGGGGGRFFTGSTSDGYTCAVCHRGGIAPTLQLRGLPEREFMPGTTYDVELVWTSPEKPHALNLEFLTPQGMAAGTISLYDPTTLERADLCDPARNEGMEGPAARLIEGTEPRQILWLDDCGAARLRFRYTAPALPKVMLAAAVVQTDDSEKPEGDGVTELKRTIYAPGLSPQTVTCALGAQQSSPRGFSALALAALWFMRRRSKRRRARTTENRG
jgi:hypothetical protein